MIPIDQPINKELIDSYLKTFLDNMRRIITTNHRSDPVISKYLYEMIPYIKTNIQSDYDLEVILIVRFIKEKCYYANAPRYIEEILEIYSKRN